jgi:hypothetical protein
VYQTTNTTAMNRAANLVHKRQAQRQHSDSAQRYRSPFNAVRCDIIASSQGNDAANCALCRPSPQVAFCLKRFRDIESP